jgi:hypothetical protein
MQLETDALKEAAAWPGADRRTSVVLASQLNAAELCQEDGMGLSSALAAESIMQTEAQTHPAAPGRQPTAATEW